MALQMSTTLRNARLDQIETTIGVSAILRIYAGTLPSSCGAAESGALLVEYDLASDWAAAASNGQKALNNLPLSVTGGAGAGAGTNATHFRFYDSTGTTCHLQGTVTATGGGGDMTLDNINIAQGQTVQVTSFVFNEPGA